MLAAKVGCAKEVDEYRGKYYNKRAVYYWINRACQDYEKFIGRKGKKLLKGAHVTIYTVPYAREDMEDVFCFHTDDPDTRVKACTWKRKPVEGSNKRRYIVFVPQRDEPSLEDDSIRHEMLHILMWEDKLVPDSHVVEIAIQDAVITTIIETDDGKKIVQKKNVVQTLRNELDFHHILMKTMGAY